MNQQTDKRLPLAEILRQKKYLTFEIPSDVSPETLLAIAEIVQYATAKLRALGVDPVRTKFHWASDIGAL